MQLINYLKESIKTTKTKDTSQQFKFSTLKRLIPYIKAHWKKAAIASFLMIVVSLLAMPSPYLMKYLIDEIFVAKNIKLLNLIIILLLVIQLIKLIFSFLTSYFFNVFNQEIMVRVKKDLFHRILRLPLSFFEKNQTGYLLSRIREVEGLRFFFSNSLIRLLIGIFEFLFSLSILFYLHWKLTLISISILPLFFFATKFYSKGLREVSREVMEKGALLSKQIQESLSGVDAVKIFTAEKRETEKIHSYLDNLKKSGIKRNIISTFSSELLSLIGTIGGLVVLWYGGLNIINGDFTIGTYIAFSAYLAKLYGPTHSLATMGLAVQPAITAMNRISEFFKLTKEEDEKIKRIKLQMIKNKIEFKNVSFSYDGNKEALKNIYITINKGEKILIAGPNGSGKSTIIKLILGLYKNKHGKIFVDGHNLNRISLSSLRERISVVSQHTFLFNDTILNNIMYSRPDAKAEDIEEAARLSGAYNFINKLDKGIETEIGEMGKNLSGGEKQKISIARAILKDTDVIILDEATSHLDSESVKRIERLLEERFQDKTCIIISPRMSKISRIDRIYVLKEGRIEKIINPDESYRSIN